LCFEALAGHKNLEVTINTPTEKNVKGEYFEENDYVFLPILRAGLGILNGVLRAIPGAKVGMIGLWRDETTALPHQYYYKVPKNSTDKTYIILDPMFATGGSVQAALEELHKQGIKKAKLICIFATPEAVEKLRGYDIEIYTASLDRGLNDKNYILPGCGDAGDRLYGTK
jgi:uracil phosphoribosyltransferase